jgi:hypothetical protein
MPFHLTNALAIFQHFMNDVFHEYLDDFVVYYINDILISPKTWKSTNDLFYLFWTSSGKSNFMPKWKNVNFIKSKWKWHFHGFLQGLHHYQLGYPNFYLRYSMFYWICQLLSTFHYALFYDSGSFYLLNS